MAKCITSLPHLMSALSVVTFAETFIDDDMFMAFAFSWGLLTDKSSFQVIVSLSSATLLATMLLLTMPITPNGGKWLYFIWVCSISFRFNELDDPHIFATSVFSFPLVHIMSHSK
uniref:Uncharacterized protein n=1 Tax=Parascaris equorum TaxID=6256 RepID=A0A914R3K5_PAREQ